MIKELSAKDCVWLRIKERLRTKDEDGYPYSYLSLCARHILMLAGLNCCEHDSQFDFGFYHIQLHSLQFFLAGHAGINAMANTNFSRQNYRKALKELEDGKWAIINTHVPVVNAKTRKISYKLKLGTIIDFSCLLTAEEIKEIGRNFSDSAYNNHQLMAQRTNSSIVEEPINTKEISGQESDGNHQKGDTTTIQKTNLVMNGSTSPLHGDGNHQKNHQLMAQRTNSSIVEEPINTKEVSGQKSDGNHQKGDTTTIQKTKKYCCCRYDELKDSVVPTDKEGYPLCPNCGKFLELNRKKQFYGHPDWATGPCRKTFSAKTLIVNWETKKGTTTTTTRTVNEICCREIY